MGSEMCIRDRFSNTNSCLCHWKIYITRCLRPPLRGSPPLQSSYAPSELSRLISPDSKLPPKYIFVMLLILHVSSHRSASFKGVGCIRILMNPTPMLIPFYTRPISKYKLSVIFFTDKMVAEFAGRAPSPSVGIAVGRVDAGLGSLCNRLYHYVTST